MSTIEEANIATIVGLTVQPNWAWCNKCQGLFYDPTVASSLCPAGGTHTPAVQSQSGNYSLPHGVPADGTRQSDWRWCNKCQGLFFRGAVAASRCPAGGTHAPASQSGSGNYSLLHRPFGWSGVRLCVDQTRTGPPLPPREVASSPPRIESDGTIAATGTIQQPLTGLTDKMWNPGTTLRVKMMGGTAIVRSKVRQFAEQWTQYANIRLEFVDPSQPAEIRIAFDPGGSWSLVGRDALWVPFDFATMNFGWFTDTTPDSEFSRVVLHEFGHALGLVHEHQSPASGIQWDREKVYAFYQETQGWDRGKVDSDVFNKYSVQSTNYSQYDRTSIMHYWVPPELTLDGQGAPGNDTLSATDKEYIRRWYPAPPTPSNATGLLRTGDDCDEIDFSVEYGVVAANSVQFRLMPASGITWWKAIEVPVSGSGYAMLQMKDGTSASRTLPRADLDASRAMRFHKAKFLGEYRLLNYTWDVIRALPGGARLSLTWKRDRC